MPSTYSSNLKLELMATGENSGTWGNITNTNLGTAAEQAIVGYGSVVYASDANLTISITNSNAAQAARALVLNVTSSLSLTGTRELVVPTIEKQYIVQNNTTGSQSITVKTSAGTGITVPNGRKAHLYVDGTNVIQMFDFVDINGGTIDGTAIGGSSASTGAFTTLSASGAATFNGAVTLGDAAADLIVFNGTVNSHLLFTDNTYDIGASGATRPRNLFLAGAATIGGNLSVGGTLTLTGGVNLNGNVTVGDSSADTLTINSTITSNLLFTDNTYDIGASGATRPRNLFLAGNATIGGNTTMTGTLTVDSTTDSTSTITGSIQTDGGLGVAKALFVGTTANIAGNVTLGGGTANGVAYLDGSKVLTTGAALTFDGTTFATTARTSATNGAWVGSGAVVGWGAAGTFSNYIVADTASNYMLFQVASAEQMRLIANNLLLGTTTQKVTTVTGGATGLTIGGASAPTIALWDTDNAAYVGYWSQINTTMYFGNNANGSIEFGTNAATKAILTGGGNFLIGTTTDAARLTVSGNVRSLGGNFELDTGQVTTNSASNPLILGVNGTEWARLTSAGYLGLNTASPTTRLSFAGGTAETLGISITPSGWNNARHRFTVPTSGDTSVWSFNYSGSAVDYSGYATSSISVGQAYIAFATGAANTAPVTIATIQPSGLNFPTPSSGNANIDYTATAMTLMVNSSSAALRFGTNSTEVGRFDSAGNMIVGGTSAGGKFTVYGSTAFHGSMSYGSVSIRDVSTTGQEIHIRPATGKNGYLTFTENAIDDRWVVGIEAGNGSLLFKSGSALSNTERMRLSSGGDLLIGTTSSSGRLTVVTGAGSQAALFSCGSGTTQQAVATFSNSTNGGYLSIAGVGTSSAVGTWTNGSMVVEGVPFSSGNTFLGSYTGALVFQNGRVNSGRFTSDGNFLIGTDSPLNNERLNVTKSINLFLSRFSNTASSGNAYGIQVVYPNVTPNNADSFFHGCYDGGGTLRFAVYSNGGVANYTANNVNLSDRREKTNFAPAGEYLAKICAIPVQTFNYIDQNMEEDPGLTLGVVAQDVQVVAPELVSESNWGTQEEPKIRLSIYQTDLQYALMKSIQELAAQVETLKAEVAALKGA